MITFKQITESVSHIIFPHQCAGCGTDLLSRSELMCFECFDKLPQTNFHLHASNPVERIFWGRVPIVNASSLYYFTKDSILQHLLHEFKYRGKKEIGTFLGERMGEALKETNRFSRVDTIIPLPLYIIREKRRGYNQAAVLASAVSRITGISCMPDLIKRNAATETQTKKGREDRWLNIEGKFTITDYASIRNKHILLIDDVITTGATLEACARAILQAENVSVSIFSLAYTSV